MIAPRVLAADPDAFVLVTEAVPGQPLAPPYRHATSPQSRRGTLRTYKQIGSAIRIVECLAAPTGPLSDGQQWAKVDRDLDRLSGWFAREDESRLRAYMAQLYREARSRTNRVYCHGDLSRSNILANKSSIGFVDFQWRIMLKGYDLVRFAHRIQYEALAMKSWTASLVTALLDGYGESDFHLSPNWRFYSLRYLLRQAGRPIGASITSLWSVKRARAKLHAELSSL
jgi:hypothetical protein